MTPKEEMMKEIVQKFVMDCDPKDNGIKCLFRINDDGSRSIAVPSDIEQFLSQKISEAARELANKILESGYSICQANGLAYEYIEVVQCGVVKQALAQFCGEGEVEG